MLRVKFDIDENANVGKIVSDFRGQGEKAGLPGVVLDQITASLSEVLSALVEKGRELSALGSQMRVSRTLAGDNYEIEIRFGSGIRKSFFARLKEKLLG